MAGPLALRKRSLLGNGMMMIINADDWGRTLPETESAFACWREGRVTSVSAMVFMEDSARAARMATESGMDVGLHLNLTEPLVIAVDTQLLHAHERIRKFLTFSKYASVLYNPVLRDAFRFVYQAQRDEFVRLYGRPPSHVDGHHHQHLCTNMLFDEVIEEGEKVRRSFYFWPDEKGVANRIYRYLVDRGLAKRYRRTHAFFALSQCLRSGRMDRVLNMARTASVELMTHPVNEGERTYLMGDKFRAQLQDLELCGYSTFSRSRGGR